MAILCLWMLGIAAVGGPAGTGAARAADQAAPGAALTALLATPLVADESTADHTAYDELDGPFESGPEVTAACLECHVNAARQLHDTTHWTWSFDNPATGQAGLGKRNVVNNFCISVQSNWPRCTSCHIGYGWEDAGFDHTAETAVDCLVCHDTTGRYVKTPTAAGHPDPAVDLADVARNVGPTSRATCGACHFNGGGEDGVKHGDLDTSLIAPNFALDVHMDAAGLNFQCATCHTTGGHAVTGSRYAPKATDTVGIDVPGHTDETRATCESCHGQTPHEDHSKLNDHTDRVACQTCHIPAFARGARKTKMWWDWSTAGQLAEDGTPVTETDADGYTTYTAKKGTFGWGADVTPEYRWFNGLIRYTRPGEPIDPSGVVTINAVEGAASDPDARIWPFKVMRSRQPYDAGHGVLALPHVFGDDDTAYWGNFDWPKALEAGMRAQPVAFSGSYGFVETETWWPLAHMVAPKDDAVGCNECHTKHGRLAALTDFYMPGRDTYGWLTLAGWGLAGLTLLACVLHGVVRIGAAIRSRLRTG
ncbi:tetrathionate reductase family octaheme c-type cytochrome [Roseospira goensis]|uniref:Octaheme c-type cytochrome (Tetrathionate reductase family) n=1 Tax=Roseospira goensis TaxID=391922 RepID=A0A7W6RXZ6_9PROT|nr:tetrathionate reductase family octaheme c-type cytochrome [Roseospira goensis]MBB4285320.1 octaheme c-type cytochrome (tetrathionate reductase family) [Roseospira goensis]